MIAIPHFGQTSSGAKKPDIIKPRVSAVPIPSDTLFNYPKSFTAFEDAIKAKNDKIAAEKEKARVEALRKAQEKQREAEASRIASKTSEEVTPVYTPPQSTSNCTTYHSSGALEQLIMHESGGNSCATNAGDCFGLLQACPGAPLRDACGGNPSCQISWFIANKTGGRSWETIWALWQRQGYW